MTTLELAYFVCDEGGKPCEKGIEFAKVIQTINYIYICGGLFAKQKLEDGIK